MTMFHHPFCKPLPGVCSLQEAQAKGRGQSQGSTPGRVKGGPSSLNQNGAPPERGRDLERGRGVWGDRACTKQSQSAASTAAP
eukprot:5960346-Amphidinium_carterae.1